MSEKPMSSFRIRTMFGLRGMGYFLSDAMTARAVEEMCGRGLEPKAHFVAFGQRRPFTGAQLHALAGYVQVDDAAVAEVLDELDARGDAVVGDPQVAGPHAQRDVARFALGKDHGHRLAGDVHPTC